jgi:carbamoyl-phosphate synthase large subunit
MNILMTGAGAPGGPGIIKALQKDKKLNLIVADADEMASGRFLNDKFYKIPKANDENFIEAIISICLKEKIEIIFPLVTLELFKFSKNKIEFDKHGIKIIVSDEKSLSIANNKSELYKHLLKFNIDVPEFRIINNIIELKSACLELGYPQKSVCIKPSISNGSRGVRILDENIDEYDLLFNFKPNNLYSNLDKIIEIIGDRPIPEMLVSEYLPGDEYTIDTIMSNGIPKLIIPRIRSKMSGGISIQGQFIENLDIIKYCTEILISLNLHGPIGIQVKKAFDGKFKILEINPRIQGTSVSAQGIGINLPLICVNQEYNEINFNEINIKWGVKFSRYFEEVYY